jgi:hypothetical protein
MLIEGKGETMTKRERRQVIGVRHVGLSARDPAALAEFYLDVLGVQVVPVDTSTLGATAFLSSRSAEVPVDLALTPLTSTPPFEVRSLADLDASQWPDGAMKNLTTRAWFALTILGVVMGLLLFIPAGTVHYCQGWVYLSIFTSASALTTLYLMRRDPALLQRRMRGDQQTTA